MRYKTVAITNNFAMAVRFLAIPLVVILTGMLATSELHASDRIFRMSNFSNEFQLTTPEGINARGTAKVRSSSDAHRVKIKVNGLTSGAAFIVINHWFDPIPARGIGPSVPTADPSCTGHFQFLGATPSDPVIANHRGRLKIRARVHQLAPHIWVVDLAKFLDVTNSGTQAPASPDAFVTGGLVIPFTDVLEAEDDFVDTDPLTNCF